MYYVYDKNMNYPEKSDEHMITVKHLRDTNFDENFEYLPKGFWHKCQRVVLWLALNLLAFPVCAIRYGVRIYGRKKLKNIKRNLKTARLRLPITYLCGIIFAC